MENDAQPVATQSAPDADAKPKLKRVLSYVREVLRGSGESFLFLAPLALIFDLTGYISPDLRLFIIYGLLAVPLCRGGKALVVKGGAGLIAVMVLNAVFDLPQVAEISLLAFAHIWIWSLAGAVALAVVQGLIFYTLLHLVLFASPLGYNSLEAIASAIRATTGWVGGPTLNIGYTYVNVGSLLLFLCLSVHLWDRRPLSKLRTLAFLGVGLLINAFSAAIFVKYVNVDPDLAWELKFRDGIFTIHELGKRLADLVLLVYPAFIFIAHAVGYLLLHHDVRKPTESAESQEEQQSLNPIQRIPRAYYRFALAAVLLLLFALPPTIQRSPSPSRMVFLNRGVVSFTKPNYERFGKAAGGMYGSYPDYAGLFGCEGVVVTDVPEKLASDQILVMTNVDKPVSQEEMDRIWSFVREGGRLWVLGDHTFIKNGRNHINDLLKPCNIRLQHDSAQFWPQGWFHSYRMRQSTPFAYLKDPAENRLSMLVGASLDLTPPARPLLMGRFGYGDWGTTDDADNRGYLGDFEYQPTERCGDLVLVAGETVGKGKVVVFGDTTSFFNANLARSYEIMRATLSWLGEPHSYSFFFSRTAGIVVIAGALVLLIISLMSRAFATPFMLVVVAAIFVIAHRPGLIKIDQAVGRYRAALIDFSHQPYAAKHGSLGEGLYGLSLSFLRYGLLPITQNTWNRELIDNSRILVLNAPRRPFSAARQREIRKFLERGGIVLFACGAAQYPNSQSLLSQLGLRVRNLPLGRFFDRPAFNEPIQYFSAFPIEVRNPNATILSVYGDWPLMVDVPVGSGHFVLIADSEFLHNKNMESHEQYSVQNIQFIRNLLDFVTGGGPLSEEQPL